METIRKLLEEQSDVIDSLFDYTNWVSEYQDQQGMSDDPDEIIESQLLLIDMIKKESGDEIYKIRDLAEQIIKKSQDLDV